MDSQQQDKIDKYLRGEMSNSEIREFENEVSSDYRLHDDLEISYMLKRSLGRHQQKLYQTSKWRQKKIKTAWLSGILVATACITVGLIIIKPSTLLGPGNEFVAQIEEMSDSTITTDDKQPLLHKNMSSNRMLASKGQTVSVVDQADVSVPNIPTVDVTLMNNSDRKHNHVNITRLSDYEQEWSIILNNLKTWDDSTVIARLKAFSNIDGVHKCEADSILTFFLK